jgi:8-oxo-dGTP diphosphatase
MQFLSTDNYIPNLSIDCVIFGFQQKELKVLISKFVFGNNIWTLPGGYIFKNESVDAAAKRILKERTQLENIYLEQFKVFGDENRIINSEHRKEMEAEFGKKFSSEQIAWYLERFVCIGFYALVDIEKVNPQKGELDQYHEWRSVKDIPKMIYDHNIILSEALIALRQNLDQKLLGFNLLPETFTIQELHALYEVIYNKPIVISNFQKRILDLNVLERLEKKFTGAQHKAPYLYRFNQSKI